MEFQRKIKNSSSQFLSIKIVPFILLIIAGFGLTYYMMIVLGLHQPGDYKQHYKMAVACINGEGCDILAYPIYHITLLLVSKVFSTQNTIFTAFISVAVFQSAAIIICYKILTYMTDNHSSVARVLLGSFLAFSLIIVAPISFQTWSSNAYYLGYVSPNSFHNPTIVALKPFALLSVWYLASFLSRSNKRAHCERRYSTLRANSITLLAAFAKPVYAICILPILLFSLMFSTYKKHDRKYLTPLLICTFSLALLLFFQYVLLVPSWVDVEPDTGIAFSPFRVMNYYIVGHESEPIAYFQLLYRFMMSVAFPVTATCLFYKATLKSPFLVVSMFCFLVGGVYTYFLAETGSYFAHGNFGWSGEIGLFLWFCSSSIVLYAETSKALNDRGWRLDIRYYICWLVFALHLYCGIEFVRCGGCW